MATASSRPTQLTTITASAQNTLTLAAGQAYEITAPVHPAGSTWRFKNIGPADVWVRFDGLANAAVDDPGSILLDQGEVLPAFVTNRLTLVCSAQPGGGARISFMLT